MNASVKHPHPSLKSHVRLLSSKAYDHFKGSTATKRMSFKNALEKHQLKSLKECLKLVQTNPDNEPLFFKNESLFHSFGPRVSKGAQMFLVHAYLRETRTEFNFKSFKKSILDAGYQEIADELKESYFANIYTSHSKSRDTVRLDHFNNPYFAKLDLHVKKDYLPAKVFEHKGLLRHIASFCDEKEISRLAHISPQANNFLFAARDSIYAHNTVPLKKSLVGHTGGLMTSLTPLSPGRLASSSLDKTIKIWNLETGVCERTLRGHTNWVNSVTSLPQDRLASGSSDRSIKIWKLETGVCERTLQGHTGLVRTLASLPQGRLASGSDDRTIKIWNLETGVCERTLQGHTNYVESLASLPQGRLASGSDDWTIKIWNLETGVCERTLQGHTGGVWALTSLSLGRLASGSSDTTIKIWNLETGVCERTLQGHTNFVVSLASLPQGRLASGSWDRSIKVWDLETGVSERTLQGHTDWVLSVASLSEGRLASASYDRTIKIWDARHDVFKKKAIQGV